MRIGIQFFGRKENYKSNGQTIRINYTEYDSYSSARSAMGSGNGGEADRWGDSLTNNESIAVYQYTQAGKTYRILNEELRKNGETTSFKSLDKNLEKALDKYTLEKPTVFERGSSADLLGGATTADEINAMVGSVVVDRAYTSSASHTGGGFGGEVCYHISTPSGKGIGAYVDGVSALKGEDEFLFNKGGMYKITGAYSNPNDSYNVHVNMEWIGREK